MTKKKKKVAPKNIVKSQDTTYILHRDTFIQKDGFRYMFRRQFEEIFNFGKAFAVVFYPDKFGTNRFPAYYQYGYLRVGCQLFSKTATARIKRWALKGTR